MTYKQHEELRDNIIDMIHLRDKINSKLREFNIDAELPSGCENISDILFDVDEHFNFKEENSVNWNDIKNINLLVEQMND